MLLDLSVLIKSDVSLNLIKIIEDFDIFPCILLVGRSLITCRVACKAEEIDSDSFDIVVCLLVCP